MKPVLAKTPALKRTLLFVPTAVGAALLVFLVLGMTTHLFDISLLVAVPAGLATAWILLGPPEVRLKDGRPLVPSAVKPYLFFPIAAILFVAFYPFVGLFLTQVAPIQFLAWATIGVSLAAGAAIAYLLVGFPKFWVGAATAWRRIPTETKPYLSFPAGLALAALFYFLIGLGLTGVDPVLAPLVAAPVGLLAAFAIAFFVFGVPRPRRLPKMPDVPGRPRPLLLAATFAVLLAPMAWLVGGALSLVPGLPTSFELPIALLAGAALASAFALLLWGGPSRWRRYPDYVPGVSREVRHAAAGPAGLVASALVMAAWTLSGLDLVWGLVLALPAGALAAFAVAGTSGVARRAADVPDRVKPLVLFPAWLALAGLIALALTAAFPGNVMWNLAAGLLVGLAVTLVALESSFLKSSLAERRAEREARARLAARRKAALAEAAETPIPEARGP
ncbi:MAG TPA: hypothetical protein VM889_10550 [Candidatus Thermoplasmatota archaeon]|nr:hypothetical protein [Candidatus Thermoplasmatota archaeon]